MFEWLDKYAVAIVIILTIVSLIFICIGHIHRKEIQLAMKKEIVTLPSTTLDIWSVSHFLLFAIFGFIIPERPVLFTTIGAAFEFAEDCLSSDATTQLANCKNKNTKQSNPICWLSINDDYWYSNWSDIFVNSFGYIAGSAIRTTWFPQKK
jgi:hypothetical protein